MSRTWIWIVAVALLSACAPSDPIDSSSLPSGGSDYVVVDGADIEDQDEGGEDFGSSGF